MRFAVSLVATLLMLLAPARAQSLFVESRFPLVGVVFDEQAVQVNVSNMGVVEVAGFDRIPGRTTVTIGDPQIRPQADALFPALTLATGQAIRINAVNIGDPNITPCPVDLNIHDAAGKTVAQHRAALAAGEATSLDILMTDPEERVQLRATGERAKDRLVKESCGTFLFSVEIYDLATGMTTLIMGDPEQ